MKLPHLLMRRDNVTNIILRILFIDQLGGVGRRKGGWSRQYDRYLKEYYGGAPKPGVSIGASLTFTGMIIYHLRKLFQKSSYEVRVIIEELLEKAVPFIMESRDPDEGGFGKLVQIPKTRGGRGIELDLRHTGWAILALLEIDPVRFTVQIKLGLNWILERVVREFEKDHWCWTSSVILRVLYDSRITKYCDMRVRNQAIRSAVYGLESSFDYNIGSWVLDESENSRERVSIDNALYVLNNLAVISNLPNNLKKQAHIAIEHLLVRCRYHSKFSFRGLPLFDSETPSVGATAQLLSICEAFDYDFDPNLKDGVIKAIEGSNALPDTFSWHLVSAFSSSIISRKSTEWK